MISETLAELTAFSNRYGADGNCVIAGGGNTSAKEGGVLYVKASGTALATIGPDGFVRMDREKLGRILDKKYPEGEKEREAAVLADMLDARVPGSGGRPSVEAMLHGLFPQKYVLHIHPSLVNGLTCSEDYFRVGRMLFPEAVFTDESKPGYLLAVLCRGALDGYRAEHGRDAELLFLRNHGVFFASDDVSGLDRLFSAVTGTLDGLIRKRPDSIQVGGEDRFCAVLTALGAANGRPCVTMLSGDDIASWDPECGSPTPDHIVYAGASGLVFDREPGPAALSASAEEFTARTGSFPRTVAVKGAAVYVCGKDPADAARIADIVKDHVKITVYAGNFGGYHPMSPWLREFIVHWEAESYRSSKA